MFRLLGTALALAFGLTAYAAPVRVTVTVLSPMGGTFITPVWVGFHNGSFDTYNPGAPASLAVERIAEDGDTSFLAADFAASGAGSVDGTLGGGPIGPGSKVSAIFSLNPLSAASRYFSYASMLVPSNDAFIGNGNPLAFQIFDPMGNFLGADFIVLGSMVRDAGTEVNDEIPMNTAFFGQMMPNTGVNENGVVMDHPGFLPAGSGGILDSAMFANADFRVAGYQIARIQVEAVPEPGTWALMLAGGGLVAIWRRRGMKA
jgi:hypothetical protein